jgi:hypothetical protein
MTLRSWTALERMAAGASYKSIDVEPRSKSDNYDAEMSIVLTAQTRKNVTSVVPFHDKNLHWYVREVYLVIEHVVNATECSTRLLRLALLLAALAAAVYQPSQYHCLSLQLR